MNPLGKHLSRYLAEFTYRFNRREGADIFVMTLSRLLSTIIMPYKNFVAETTQ